MTDCIFCDIISGASPASFVYRNDVCSAFMDIQPVNSGHVLVIPNHHASFLSELPSDTGAEMFKIAKHIAQAIRESGLRCEGINLFLADGAAAFQDVFHVHLHVIPRFRADGFGLVLPPDYRTLPHRDELDRNANSIVSAMPV